MSAAGQRRILVAGLMFLAAWVFLPGLNWGLPSRRADAYLFGGHPVWSGAEIQRLAGERRDDPTLGANVPQHVLADRDQILVLNETDEQRAEIIRRYRLYSYQPDENTLLMALARMKPGQGDFDPKFYQYGGLFVYPVGVLLKVAAMLRLVHLTPDVAWYIDHPAAFGRFYVVARLVPALWGIAGVWAVFWIARRLSGGLWVPAAATVAYIVMPVVVNMAHEAKPHLPGAVLMLLAIIAACRYVETGTRRHALGAGALCGAAMGTVLSAALIFIVIPAMALIRRDARGRRIYVVGIAAVLGAVTYFATNPYVAINLIRNRAVLRSNLTNSTDMYHVGGWRDGVPNALRLLGEGASPGLALAGVVAAVYAFVAARRRQGGSHDRPRGGRFALGVLLACPSVLILSQYLSLAAGKPGEYGRFAILPDIILGITAITGASMAVRSRAAAGAVIAALLIGVAVPGWAYLQGFLRDTYPVTSRSIAAGQIESFSGDQPMTIGVWAEPAPYAVPPVNLFRDRLVLLPVGYVPKPIEWPADVFVRAEDEVDRTPPAWATGARRIVVQRGRPTRISWADKPFVIYLQP
jgi:hypothetical protein